MLSPRNLFCFLILFRVTVSFFPAVARLLSSRSRNTFTFSCNLLTQRFRCTLLLKSRPVSKFECVLFLSKGRCLKANFFKRYFFRSLEETTLEMNWRCFWLFVFFVFFGNALDHGVVEHQCLPNVVVHYLILQEPLSFRTWRISVFSMSFYSFFAVVSCIFRLFSLLNLV